MDTIKQIEIHNIYAQSLILMRVQFTGKSAQIGINNNKKLKFNAIIDRLNDSYADQRPLYVLEEEIMNIRQYRN